MHFEPTGIHWTEVVEDSRSEHTMPSYHCGLNDCTVRYLPEQGYFTVINAPDIPNFVEEPGVNLLQCPKHGTWLYRRQKQHIPDQIEWCCGVDGCTYCHSDIAGIYLRE